MIERLKIREASGLRPLERRLRADETARTSQRPGRVKSGAEAAAVQTLRDPSSLDSIIRFWTDSAKRRKWRSRAELGRLTPTRAAKIETTIHVRAFRVI